MGLYDRDYFRSDTPTSVRGFFASAVRTIIVLNVAIWLVQLLTDPRGNPPSPVTLFLACSPEDLFGGFPQVWKLVTACFAHSTEGVGHVFFNMFLLYIFGRELEGLYGKRDFLIFYLTAGALSILVESIVQQISGHPQTGILGASGSVMALVVLLTTFYPHRRVHLIFLPMFTFPLWGLCVFVVIMDLTGAFSPSSSTANFAHLAGAAFGFGYRYYDLRWANVRRRLSGIFARRPRGRVPKGWTVLQKPAPTHKPEPEPEPETDAVSGRIDELLAKISRDGKDSLTEEEWTFLTENSSRYRNPS